MSDEVAYIQHNRFELCPTGLIAHGEPSFDDWLTTGETLRRLGVSIQWALGDWLSYGERQYGERYAQALDEINYEYKTLCNYAYVAKCIPQSRRRETLTFSHHAEVAALPPHEQSEKLNMAEQMGMTVRELRALIKTDVKPQQIIYTYTARVVEDGSAIMLEIIGGDIEALFAMRHDPITVTVKLSNEGTRYVD